MGGNNDEENLIDLFAREHFIAHKLLAQENSDNKQLIHAWALMSRLNKSNEKRIVTPEEYEEAKKAYISLIKGKPLSEEHRRKIGNATRGHMVPESARQTVGKANADRIWSQESRRKLSNTISGQNHPLFGTHPTEETRIKISNSNKGVQAGEKNPRALIVVQLDDDYNIIKVWKYIKLASKELHIDASDISGCAKGRLKHAGGYCWKFLYENKLHDKPVPGAISLGLITEKEAMRQLK